MKTEEARIYRRGLVSRGVVIAPDGSFRAEDLPPGNYVLKAFITSRRAGPGVRFRVPEGEGADPVNLGLIRLEVGEDPRQNPPPAAGDEGANEALLLARTRLGGGLGAGAEAPGFEVEGLKEGAVRLEDFRGRYVLLSFWAPWFEPGLAEWPQWEAVAEAYRGEERLAVVWLGLGGGKEEVAKALSDRGGGPAGAVQGFLGPWLGNPVAAEYGVTVVPTTFLIGPDGKVLEAGVRGEDLLKTLKEHLPGR